MEPTLAVIGLNFRMSPVAVRERFWISEGRHREALHRLIRSEGIDEVMVLATCSRTEFILWASDVPTAANSVLRFLTQEFRLRLCEWSHFYRLMDDAAVNHIFGIAAGLDCMIPGDPGNVDKLKHAWDQAQSAGTTGRFLDAVVQKSFSVCHRAQSETTIGSGTGLLANAIVELSKETFGELAGHEVLLVGAGKMAEAAAKALVKSGATHVRIANRSLVHSEELARNIDAVAIPWEKRFLYWKNADLAVTATSSAEFILDRQQAEHLVNERRHRPLAIIDLAVPRTIDPGIQDLDGIHLFDIDDLEQLVKRNLGGRLASVNAAEKIVQAESTGFCSKLTAEQNLPTVVALRQHLDELCKQELELLRQELGPFTEDQDQALTTLTTHITQRIAGTLARELKQVPEKEEQKLLTTAVGRLFHLKERQTVVNTRN